MNVYRLICMAAACLALRGGDADLEGLQKGGHWKRIRSQVNARLQAQPGNPQMLVWRSRVEEAFNQPEQACRTAKQATELAPQSAEAWAQFSAMSGAMAGRAGLLSKLGHARDCKAAGERALALDPRNRLALEVLVVFHEQAPGLIGGSRTKADAYRHTLAGLDPDAGLQQEVSQAFASKDRARIEGALKKAVSTRSEEVWPHLWMARAALDPAVMRTQEAQAAARKALALRPDHAEALGLLAQALAAEGRWKEVEETLARAEQQVPDNFLPHYMVGRYLVVARREPLQAEALFRRYLSQEPEGGCPSRAGAHWRLGLALEMQGRKAEAIQQLQTALSLQPDFADAKRDLKRLG